MVRYYIFALYLQYLGHVPESSLSISSALWALSGAPGQRRGVLGLKHGETLAQLLRRFRSSMRGPDDCTVSLLSLGDCLLSPCGKGARAQAGTGRSGSAATVPGAGALHKGSGGSHSPPGYPQSSGLNI